MTAPIQTADLDLFSMGAMITPFSVSGSSLSDQWSAGSDPQQSFNPSTDSPVVTTQTCLLVPVALLETLDVCVAGGTLVLRKCSPHFLPIALPSTICDSRRRVSSRFRHT